MDDMPRGQEQESARVAQIRLQGKKVYRIFGFALLILLLAQVALPIFLSMALEQLAPWIAFDLTISLLLTYGSMYLVGFPVLWLMLGALPDRMPHRPCQADERLGPGRIFGLYAMLSALSSLLVLFVSICLEFLNYEGREPFQGLMEGGVSPWLLFVLAVVVAPVMEELIFRWLPYRKLSGFGMWYYVLWTSLAFALFHINLLQGVYAFALGIVFAIITYRTGSVKYSILLHFLVNLTSGLGLGGLATESELGTMLYGGFTLFLWAVGIVVLIRCLRSRFFRLRDPCEGEALENWRSAFLSGGYIAFVVLCVALILLFG